LRELVSRLGPPCSSSLSAGGGKDLTRPDLTLTGENDPSPREVLDGVVTRFDGEGTIEKDGARISDSGISFGFLARTVEVDLVPVAGADEVGKSRVGRVASAEAAEGVGATAWTEAVSA
jgi:hypothetical protein